MYQVNEEDRKFIHTYYGFECIKNMIEEIDNNTTKVIKNIKTKTGEYIKQEIKRVLYFYAHNGKGFDSYIIFNDPIFWKWMNEMNKKQEYEIGFKNIVKNTSGLLQL